MRIADCEFRLGFDSVQFQQASTFRQFAIRNPQSEIYYAA